MMCDVFFVVNCIPYHTSYIIYHISYIIYHISYIIHHISVKKPNYLQKGDKIGIIAPAKRIRAEEITFAIELLESWGLEIVLSKHLFGEYYQFSGTPDQRQEDLQEMLDNKEIKAILCARGGYGCVQYVDKLDFTKFLQQPKWLVGFSDVTVLLAKLLSLEIMSLHAPMPAMFPKNTSESLERLRKCLFGDFEKPPLTPPLKEGDEKPPLTPPLKEGDEKLPSFEGGAGGGFLILKPHQYNRNGIANAMLVGGNICLIATQIGTPTQINTQNKILFLEDVGEYLYNLDRMLHQYKRAGMFEHLSGLIIGQISKSKPEDPPFDKTEYEIVRDIVAEYNFPVAYNFPTGHEEENYALICGEKAFLEVKTENVTFYQK